MTKRLLNFDGTIKEFATESAYLAHVMENGKKGYTIGDKVRVLKSTRDTDYWHNHAAGEDGEVIRIKDHGMPMRVHGTGGSEQWHEMSNIQAVHKTGDGHTVEIGMHLVGNEKATYGYTSTGVEVVVKEIRSGGLIGVSIKRDEPTEQVYTVDAECFDFYPVASKQDESDKKNPYGLHEVYTMKEKGSTDFSVGDHVVKIGHYRCVRLSDGLEQYVSPKRLEPSKTFVVGGYALANKEADRRYRFTTSDAKLRVKAVNSVGIIVEIEETHARGTGKHDVIADRFVPAITPEQLDAIKDGDYSLYGATKKVESKPEAVAGAVYEMLCDFTDSYGDKLKNTQYVVLSRVTGGHVYAKRKSSGKVYAIPRDELNTVAKLIALPIND